MLQNGDWLLNVKYIDFLREIGVHFSVNKMLTAECFKTRLERGLSFIEFNYMLMQSYDFLKLNEDHGCEMELGGDDQWANILGGVDLVRRVKSKEVFGMTFTLLTTKEGKKMGKTEKGAVWLDPEKTTPYEFFQYWRNIDDADVVNCLKMITFVPLDEIKQYENLSGSELNVAKERLAYELTKLVHGEDEAIKALDTAKSLFGNQNNAENMPSTEIDESELSDGKIGLLDAMLRASLIPSKGEGRRLVQQGGVSVDDVKIVDVNFALDRDALKTGVVIKKGKKVYHKICLK
jgi:tyrosyl-tRNA synthetase